MKSEIWAIGGGKGGTGKSFITSSMGLSLARQGKRVTLIDADLGGANLHSFLNIKKPRYSLTDFFERKIPLSDIINDTDIPNLRFVTGDIRTLNATGIKYVQQLKLYRHIKNINTDYVLIDLGAGSFHTTIDTFLVADKMIAVTLPEITAIENLYIFIKKVLFRKLNRLLSDHGLRDGAKEAWSQRNTKNIKNIKDLIQHIKDISPEICTVVEKAVSEFTLHIVMNQVKNEEHIETGFSTKNVIRKYFGIDARYSGYVKYNEFFWKFVKESGVFKPMTQVSATTQEVGSLLQHLVESKPVNLTEITDEAG
jgi:flagellar biosynthesis protein FlhG